MSQVYSIDEQLFLKYLERISPPANNILEQIKIYNRQHLMGHMMLSDIQVRLLVWLANLIGTRYYLEVGVYTGYSSTVMGLNLPAEAKMVLCDLSVTYTDVARYFWKKAGIENKITLYLQPALLTLQECLAERGADFFDFIFLDGDKKGLPLYVEASYPLLRPGGVIAIDNTYLRGRVAEEDKVECNCSSVQVVKKFNQSILNDIRFQSVMLPLGDGLTLLIKK